MEQPPFVPYGPLPLPPKPVGPFIIVGGYVDRTSAVLRFFGDDLDPEQVTRLLGCHPSHAYRKGDLLPSKRYQRIAHTGSWQLQTHKDDSQKLEEQIASLLNSVSDNLLIWEQLTQVSRADIFCGLHLKAWNRGLSLSAELMGRIAERGLKLEFDIYCDGKDEVEMSDVYTSGQS